MSNPFDRYRQKQSRRWLKGKVILARRGSAWSSVLLAIREGLIAEVWRGTAPHLTATLVGVVLGVAETLMCGLGPVTPLTVGLIPERLNRAAQAG